MMSLVLASTILLSCGICFLNYLGCKGSNLSSAYTLLIDSIVDLIFPILSLISIYFANPALDRFLILGQAFLIFAMSIYFVSKKITKYEEVKMESRRSLIVMILSMILSLFCLNLTKSLASSTENASIAVTSSHFQIDVVLKICVIIISMVQLSQLKRKIKMLLMIFLDIVGTGYAFFASGSNLLGIAELDKDLSQFTHLFISFLIGAIPFCVILPLIFFNIKITELGSKNPGTSNVSRVLSAKFGRPLGLLFTIICGSLDLFKGILPGLLFPGQATPACLIAVLGHIYSPFLAFKGGKAVGTFLGAMFGATCQINFLAPPLAWIILDSNKKIVSLLPVRIVNEWIIWRSLKIKQTFVNTLFVMIYGLVMISFSRLTLVNKLRFFIIFGVVCLQHDSNVSVEK